MGTRKSIFRSVIVYTKNVPNQCNLTAQIEPVQDKYMCVHLKILQIKSYHN
jgi:hypothetical protein